MDSSKERKCIEKSLALRIASSKARLAKIQKEGIALREENPLSGLIEGIRGGITWEEKTSGKINQILILPLLILVILFMMILNSLIHITHCWDIHKKKQELKKEIRELENVRINKNYSALQYDYQRDKRVQKALSFWGVELDKDTFTSDIPKDNTLWSLWRRYGLDKDTFSSEERIGLVQEWLDTLYGKELTKNLNVEERVQATIDCNAEVHKRFHESNKGLHRCILFMNPLDSVIRELSKELLNYKG